MFERGVRTLTGKDMKASFGLFFEPGDVVGIKVNPVGPPLINTHVELAQAVVKWLLDNKVPQDRIVIWDRFDYMLKDAGFTPDQFPKASGSKACRRWTRRGTRGRTPAATTSASTTSTRTSTTSPRASSARACAGYKDDEFYLNQHVYNGEYSYFGKLVTKQLTKIVNLAAYKNTGAGISMATKNMGYGSLCNTGRLHAPLFFNVCTEVLAAPVVREKLVLNVTEACGPSTTAAPTRTRSSSTRTTRSTSRPTRSRST